MDAGVNVRVCESGWAGQAMMGTDRRTDRRGWWWLAGWLGGWVAGGQRQMDREVVGLARAVMTGVGSGSVVSLRSLIHG